MRLHVKDGSHCGMTRAQHTYGMRLSHPTVRTHEVLKAEATPVTNLMIRHHLPVLLRHQSNPSPWRLPLGALALCGCPRVAAGAHSFHSGGLTIGGP